MCCSVPGLDETGAFQETRRGGAPADRWIRDFSLPPPPLIDKPAGSGPQVSVGLQCAKLTLYILSMACHKPM